MTESNLKLRRRRVRHAVVLDGTRTATARLLAALREAGVREVVLVGGSVESPGDMEIRSAATFAEALALVPTDADTIICDPMHDEAPRWVADLVTDRRPNVIVVQPRLPHHIDVTKQRFVLEPIDVPWFSRRVMEVSDQLAANRAHGEAIAFGILAGGARASLGTVEDFFDVCHELAAAGADLYAHAVPAPAWEAAEGAEVLAAG